MFHIDELLKLQEDDFYEALFQFAEGLMSGERNLIANLSNIASLLYNTMDEVNWVGFYLAHEDELILGPFHGKPACIRIPFGKGVCGKAAKDQQTQRVKNVHEFPDHIACDGDTLSELVIPIIIDTRVVGVLDIDSPVLDRFNETTQHELEQLVKLIISNCDWEV
jgi:L-methionine (R)-S-oxide reductase